MPKPGVPLSGRPLASYPLAILKSAFGDVALVAKRKSDADGLDIDHLWLDDFAQFHPLAGIVTALRRSSADEVLVCACDLPFVTAPCAREILDDSTGGSIAVASSGGRIQPLFAAYPVSCLKALEQALKETQPMLKVVSEHNPIKVNVPEKLLFNINTRSDLTAAEKLLGR